MKKKKEYYGYQDNHVGPVSKHIQPPQGGGSIRQSLRHLLQDEDRYFCTPKIDEEAARAKREQDLEAEKEKLKKEYEEKQRKKKEKEEKDKKDKSKDDKDKDEKDKPDDKPDKKEENDEASKEEEPRTFELKTAFYQQRLQRKRQAEAAKRDKERVSKPGYFPSVPTEPPTK
ncbi:hypothetical protein HC256_008168 [Beauveria bassiana]|nr:hypothetical protein HC256_008168 [Beauveria bassiana]